MGIKASLSKVYAAINAKKISRWRKDAVSIQKKVLQELVKSAVNTTFGKEHHFNAIKSYDDFKKNVPIQDYEGLRKYIDRIVAGEADVLWHEKSLYLAKTSGTTSGVKYIPLTKASLPEQITAARDALLNYIHETGKCEFVHGKMIFVQGSPVLEKKNGIDFGRLSGIVAHH